MNKKTFLFFLFGILSMTLRAHAAMMYLLPSATKVSFGQEFNVDIKIDTSDASTSINAAQATVQFPIGILDAVSVDTQSSTFGFWLQGPTISNGDGAIQLVGGSIKGVAGSALQVARITFKAVGAGSASLNIVNAVVAAADGKGTNVLAGIQGTSVAVGVAAIPMLPDAGVISVEQPALVQRPAVAAAGLPAAPILSVPLYPDQSRWYDQLGDMIVLWDVPADVTQVAANVSHAKNNTVGMPQVALSNGKDFGALQDGIWYVSVRFRNNIGWGPPAYYKISVDTTPPLPFDARIENAGTDDPSPTVQFETSDSLSGIAGYMIAVDGTVLTTTTTTSMTLPAQPPGVHTLVVSASDLAGNSVQDSASFKVLPLPTPQITFVEPSVSQGQFVFATGSGVPSSSVEVVVVGSDNQEIFDGMTPVGSDGHWDITVKIPLAIGRYSLTTTAHDDRGARSLTSGQQPFNVRAASVISFGIIELGWFEILIIVILTVITGVSLWLWRALAKKQKRGLYSTVAGRDVEKLSDLLSTNIKNLSNLPSIKNATDDPELAYLLEKINENVTKNKKYLKQELEKLK